MNPFSPIQIGSIPACAGEPAPVGIPRRPAWVYPRVRGGAVHGLYAAINAAGLSPRARGSPGMDRYNAAKKRSIPACAGEPSLSG